MRPQEHEVELRQRRILARSVIIFTSIPALVFIFFSPAGILARGAACRQGGARALAHAEQHAGGPSRAISVGAAAARSGSGVAVVGPSAAAGAAAGTSGLERGSRSGDGDEAKLRARVPAAGARGRAPAAGCLLIFLFGKNALVPVGLFNRYQWVPKTPVEKPGVLRRVHWSRLRGTGWETGAFGLSQPVLKTCFLVVILATNRCITAATIIGRYQKII